MISEDQFHDIRAINRPHRPDSETCAFIHEAYLLLRRAPASYGVWAKQDAFEAVAANAFSWRVVGIAEVALRSIVANNSGEGLCRAHWFDRKSRYLKFFGEGSAEATAEELVDFFYEHDTTIVVPKQTNNAKIQDHRKWGAIHPVPEGLFVTRGYKFAVRQRTELPWARKVAAELGL